MDGRSSLGERSKIGHCAPKSAIISIGDKNHVGQRIHTHANRKSITRYFVGSQLDPWRGQRVRQIEVGDADRAVDGCRGKTPDALSHHAQSLAGGDQQIPALGERGAEKRVATGQ